MGQLMTEGQLIKAACTALSTKGNVLDSQHQKPKTNIHRHHVEEKTELKMTQNMQCGGRLFPSCSILRAFQRICQGSHWAPQVGCPESQPYLGSCLDLLHAAQIVKKNYSFAISFFQGPKRLGHLVFYRFTTFDRFVQLLVIVVHGLPF